MKTLLITPPLLQMNSPYPATAYLAGYLRSKGIEVFQKDMSLELLLQLFSPAGLRSIQRSLLAQPKILGPGAQFFLDAFSDYESTIAPIVGFLQGRFPQLALRICNRHLIPEGPRFEHLKEHPEILESFGVMGTQDMAKYLASLYLDDIVDVIQSEIDPHFGFSRYGESLASSQISFTPLENRLQSSPSLIDDLISELTQKYIKELNPQAIGYTVPFPGNLYSALRSSREAKLLNPSILTIMGGGFVNTELRNLEDPRIFEWIDHVVFDDGERALELLLRGEPHTLRTLSRQQFPATQVLGSLQKDKDLPFKDHPGPDFSDFNFNDYVSMMELPNPVHRLWSDFKWNKMILAHGCYWKKCSFCDVNLDYISRFEPHKSNSILAQMAEIAKTTGTPAFHFVDEAAPPALLNQLSDAILKSGQRYTWWGNIRFDKQFTPELCEKMADAGCVAVTGGLEVASPRVLKLIGKGVSVEQVAKVTKAFFDSGIFVHAYLMYGFPTETTQETVDSLEVVRQLFINKCIHSGHWHRFLATAHSPVGRNPENFGIELQWPEAPKSGAFAINAIPFEDPTPTPHDELGQGLRKALYNFMHGKELEAKIQDWFEIKVPKPTIPPNWLEKILQ